MVSEAGFVNSNADSEALEGVPLRQTVAYWEDQVSASSRHQQEGLADFAKYSAWLRGDMSDITGGIRRTLRCRETDVVSVNLFSLVTKSLLGDLFYRAPRAFCKPTQGFGPSVFSPELAKLETKLLNDWIEEADLYGTGRRCLIDGLISPSFCVKVGYSSEIAVDQNLIDEQRQVAQIEDQLYTSVGTKMRLKDTDLDKVHSDQHNATLAAIERGDILVPEKAIEYLKKHIKKHDERMKKGGSRSAETIRWERVFARRVNPLRLIKDPWAESDNELEWIGEMFLRPIEEVHNNPKYDPEARMAVNEVNTRHENLPEVSALIQETVNSSEKYALLYEIVDLKGGKVITFSKGATKPLRVVDYALHTILPSGPYILSSFFIDPVTDIGIPSPRSYESHQRAATFMATLNQLMARRNIAKMVYASDHVDETEIEKIKSATLNGIVPLKGLAGKNIKDIFQWLEPSVIPDQNIAIEERQKRYIEQLSGRGSANLGGGDFAKTATASAIVNESTSSMSEDYASVMDDWLSRVLRAVLRLMRRFYTPARVAELVGDEALDIWPAPVGELNAPVRWSERDIRQDKGCSVVPGSARRKNEAVERQQLMELYAATSSNPMLPPTVSVELLKRIFDAHGLYGFDLSEMQSMMEQQLAQQQAQQAMAAAGVAPPPGGEGPPTESGMAQGMANVGGGRVPTGASEGDAERPLR